jgi:type 1 glutamine amidotransferase
VPNRYIIFVLDVKTGIFINPTIPPAPGHHPHHTMLVNVMKPLSLFLTGLLILGIGSQASTFGQSNQNQKKALAILGDFWHAVAPLNNAIVRQMEEKGYQTDIVLDYNAPFDRLSEYDLVVLSRYSVDDFRNIKEKERDARKNAWLTPAQEEAIETYVKNGGHIFFHHDGIGFYPRDSGISRLAKAYFHTHPPAVPITVEPVGNYANLNEGIHAYTIKDEEYVLDIDTTATHVFMQSYSPENGHAYQGWAHDYEAGQVVVFVPGHDRYSLAHPMVLMSISNILDAFDR